MAQIDVIPAGTTFGEDEIVHYAERGSRGLDDVLADVDLLVTGPHASAAFPEELLPFVDPGFTRRLQYDFTDISTSPVARRWAEIDRHILYVENPHPRAVRDANRPAPPDLEAELREAFGRLDAAGPDDRPSLGGVDAVRPVTFGYVPVWRRPGSDADWAGFADALRGAAALGVERYEAVRDDLIERVIDAKLRRLAALDPDATTATEWASATHLDVLAFHDTMNLTSRPDGALCVERPPADRLPDVVSLANRGDAAGDVAVDAEAGVRAEAAVPTMAPARLRAIARAYRLSFEADDPDDVAFNRPYLGGYEVQSIGPRLRALEPRCVVRTGDDGPPRRLRFGVWQDEFLREFLLGPDVTAHLAEPGTDWAGPPDDRVDWLAGRMRAAHDLVRSWSAAGGGVR